MKKIILSLFLVLATISYSAIPNFLNEKRFQNQKYDLIGDFDGQVAIFHKIESESTKTISYWYSGRTTSESIDKELYEEALANQLSLKQSLRMGKALVKKYATDNGFIYTVVFKNNKPDNIIISVSYFSPTEYPNSQLNKLVDGLLVEAESFTKK